MARAGVPGKRVANNVASEPHETSAAKEAGRRGRNGAVACKRKESWMREQAVDRQEVCCGGNPLTGRRMQAENERG